MDAFISMIIQHLRGINWEGPAIFAIILLVLLAIFRKWSILLLTLLTIVLGWGAEDLIITNISNNTDIISVPFLIYCIGGGLILIFILVSFFKSST